MRQHITSRPYLRAYTLGQAPRERSPLGRSLGLITGLCLTAFSGQLHAQAVGEPIAGVPPVAAAAGAAESVESNAVAGPQPVPIEETPKPPPAVSPPAAPTVASTAKPAPAAPKAKPVDTEPNLTSDDLTVAGYMPGYRKYESLGMSPHVPRYDGFPGGIVPAFGMPNRADDWTFRFSGSMNVSLQASTNHRRVVEDGQAGTVYHTPPMTIEEWSSFASTSSVPGNWVGLNFAYGNSKVTARASIDTWNPTQPTTYYQLGTQYFINNSYIEVNAGSFAGVRLQFNAGFFSTAYGHLSRYGGGMYVNPIAGLIRGVGETTRAEYDLTDKLTLTAEHGIMTPRNGKVPYNVIASPINGYTRATWPASFVHHVHAGLNYKGDTQYQLQLHYLHNWAQDEQVQMAFDNPVTRQMNETNIPDGSISIYAADVRAINDVYGYLALGAAYLKMNHAYPIKGVMTYGGDGENLADRWLGLPADGTGSMLVTALNYTVSLGKIVSHPTPFNGDGPDIVLNAGVHWATTWSDYQAWNRRDRYKGGLDALYTLMRYLGVGCRFDTVVPNSKDMDETFYVLAPRIQLKTDWTSRESLNLMYARWFYGSKTRNEGTGERTPERLDNQLFALNFNLWW